MCAWGVLFKTKTQRNLSSAYNSLKSLNKLKSKKHNFPCKSINHNRLIGCFEELYKIILLCH